MFYRSIKRIRPLSFGAIVEFRIARNEYTVIPISIGVHCRYLPRMDTNDELVERQTFCVRAMKRYMDKARKTCLIVTNVHAFPVSLEMRSEILHQRQTENPAHESYQVARKQLFEAAPWDGEPFILL